MHCRTFSQVHYGPFFLQFFATLFARIISSRHFQIFAHRLNQDWVYTKLQIEPAFEATHFIAFFSTALAHLAIVPYPSGSLTFLAAMVSRVPCYHRTNRQPSRLARFSLSTSLIASTRRRGSVDIALILAPQHQGRSSSFSFFLVCKFQLVVLALWTGVLFRYFISRGKL